MDKNNNIWPNNQNKTSSASQTKSNRKSHRSIGKKKHHDVSQEELMLQFGLVADPSYSNHHNACNVLANTPTWYYFSAHPTSHSMTSQKIKNQIKFTLTARPGTKIHPTHTLTNSWTQIRSKLYNRLFRSVYLRFNFRW